MIGLKRSSLVKRLDFFFRRTKEFGKRGKENNSYANDSVMGGRELSVNDYTSIWPAMNPFSLYYKVNPKEICQSLYLLGALCCALVMLGLLVISIFLFALSFHSIEK